MLLLIMFIPLYGYIQPFKGKVVNILEFVFLVDILLLQMIKSTNDIQVRLNSYILRTLVINYCLQAADI